MNTPSCNITSIPTYPKYGITSKGDVYSNCYGEWRKLRPYTDNQGYIYFTIRSEVNKPKKVKLHRLVLMTFDRLPKEGEICRHLDGNRLNNIISNLKWVTYAENTYDAFYVHKTRTGKKNEEHWNCRLSNEQIINIRKEYSSGNFTQRSLGEK